MFSELHHQHHNTLPQLTGSYTVYVKRTRRRHWPNLTNEREKTLGLSTVHSQRTWSNSVNFESFQDHFTWNDSMMVMTLKLRWLHTVQNIIRHAGSSTTTPNCREQKKTHSRKKVREMRNNLHANSPGYIHGHRVHRRSQKLVSSVNSLLGLTVLGKLQHSKWTDGCVTVQPFLVMQNCWSVSVVETW